MSSLLQLIHEMGSNRSRVLYYILYLLSLHVLCSYFRNYGWSISIQIYNSYITVNMYNQWKYTILRSQFLSFSADQFKILQRLISARKYFCNNLYLSTFSSLLSAHPLKMQQRPFFVFSGYLKHSQHP